MFFHAPSGHAVRINTEAPASRSLIGVRFIPDLPRRSCGASDGFIIGSLLSEQYEYLPAHEVRRALRFQLPNALVNFSFFSRDG